MLFVNANISYMDVENILFDFNGTIVNDVDLCLTILNDMLTLRKHNVVDLKQYLEIFDFPVIEYYKKSGFIFPKDNFDELAKYFITRYKKESIYCPLQNHVKDILDYFTKIGKKLYIVSASEKNLLLDQLKTYKIDQYFLDVSGLDNINASSKVETSKQFVKEKNFNLDKTIFIGDTLHDYEVSKQIGINCILLAKGHQSKERLLKSGCIVIDDLIELKSIIK